MQTQEAGNKTASHFRVPNIFQQASSVLWGLKIIFISKISAWETHWMTCFCTTNYCHGQTYNVRWQTSLTITHMAGLFRMTSTWIWSMQTHSWLLGLCGASYGIRYWFPCSAKPWPAKYRNAAMMNESAFWSDKLILENASDEYWHVRSFQYAKTEQQTEIARPVRVRNDTVTATLIQSE